MIDFNSEIIDFHVLIRCLYKKDKNLLDDIKDKSLNELTKLVDYLVEKLEKEKNLDDTITEYQKLVSINNLIQKNSNKLPKTYPRKQIIKLKNLKK